MLLAEAAAVIGIDEIPRTYFGKEAVAAAFKAIDDSSKGVTDIPSDFSPVTLNESWPWLWRIFFLMLFTGVGSFVNVFFIASFFTSDELKKKGNVFFACLGFADLMITGMVVPSSIVVMLAKIKENIKICHVMQLMAHWSTYAYSIFFMLVAVDIYTRLVCGFICYRKCIVYPLSAVAILNFAVSLATAGAGVYYDLDYDYCSRQHEGNYIFRVTTTVLFYVIPAIVTFCLLFQTSVVMKDRVIRLIRYKRLPQFQKDHSLTNLHLGCFLLFVAAWAPYLVLVNMYPDADDAKYYILIWLGLLRSGVTSFLYSVINKTLRVAFYNLFIYFCCKGPLAKSDGRARKFYGNGVNGRVLRNTNSPRREPPVMFVM